jgi:Ice-binding-like/Bacterial Ig-like domain
MRLTIFVATLSCLLVACGGSGGQDPILGSPNVNITPHIVSTSPVTQTPIVTDVLNSARLTATFNVNMAASTLNASSFTVACPVGTPVVSTVTYDAENRTAILRHAAAFRTGTTCEAKISTAATNTFGTALVSEYAWRFTTQTNTETTAPTILNFSPASGASSICLTKNVSVIFSEPMDPATITAANFFVSTVATPTIPGTVTYDTRNNTATFATTNAFDVTTAHTIHVTAGAKDLAGNPMVEVLRLFTTGTQPCTTASTVSLGTISTYAGFGGGAGATNSGVNTVIHGDLGTTAACTLITGFDDAENFYTETPLNIGDVTGHIYCGPPSPGTQSKLDLATAAAADARAAFNTLAGLAPTADLGLAAGELGGATVLPGIYKPSTSSASILTGDLTLNADGNSEAEWVFQVPTSLTVGLTATPRRVLLINGAQAKNVYWQVGSAARIENGSAMVGTIIASAGVTISTAGQTVQTTLSGRAIGLNASVTMVNTTVTVP